MVVAMWTLTLTFVSQVFTCICVDIIIKLISFIFWRCAYTVELNHSSKRNSVKKSQLELPVKLTIYKVEDLLRGEMHPDVANSARKCG